MNQELQIATLEGENAILKEELERTQKEAHHFYKLLDFWRSSYLKDHPELDDWNMVSILQEEFLNSKEGQY